MPDKVTSAYFRSAKKELAVAKKAGDKRTIKRLMDEAEGIVDDLIAQMPVQRQP
jgi:hypothetical protein